MSKVLYYFGAPLTISITLWYGLIVFVTWDFPIDFASMGEGGRFGVFLLFIPFLILGALCWAAILTILGK